MSNYYAATNEFDHDLSIHVFATRAERDEWLSGDLDEGKWEYGPREAIGSEDARRLFAIGAYPRVEAITLHGCVRPRGLRKRIGTSEIPAWLDDQMIWFNDIHNVEGGIDMTKTNVYARWT